MIGIMICRNKINCVGWSKAYPKIVGPRMFKGKDYFKQAWFSQVLLLGNWIGLQMVTWNNCSTFVYSKFDKQKNEKYSFTGFF